MSLEVEETSALRSAESQNLVRYDERQKTYALIIPNDPAGRTIPISYCPWCSAKLRRAGAHGLTGMTPDTCRKARKAISMTHRQLADAIGESLATIYGYETGKPTEDAVVDKLLRFFQECHVTAHRSGRITRYRP